MEQGPFVTKVEQHRLSAIDERMFVRVGAFSDGTVRASKARMTRPGMPRFASVTSERLDR